MSRVRYTDFTDMTAGELAILVDFLVEALLSIEEWSETRQVTAEARRVLDTEMKP